MAVYPDGDLFEWAGSLELDEEISELEINIPGPELETVVGDPKTGIGFNVPVLEIYYDEPEVDLSIIDPALVSRLYPDIQLEHFTAIDYSELREDKIRHAWELRGPHYTSFPNEYERIRAREAAHRLEEEIVSKSFWARSAQTFGYFDAHDKLLLDGDADECGFFNDLIPQGSDTTEDTENEPGSDSEDPEEDLDESHVTVVHDGDAVEGHLPTFEDSDCDEDTGSEAGSDFEGLEEDLQNRNFRSTDGSSEVELRAILPDSARLNREDFVSGPITRTLLKMLASSTSSVRTPVSTNKTRCGAKRIRNESSDESDSSNEEPNENPKRCRKRVRRSRNFDSIETLQRLSNQTAAANLPSLLANEEPRPALQLVAQEPTTTIQPSLSLTQGPPAVTNQPYQTLNQEPLTAANQPGRNTWSEMEQNAIEQEIRRLRAEEASMGLTGKKGLRDTKLWGEISCNLLANHQVNRSASACKNQWSRYGRARSGFDERAEKDPNNLATSVQKKKGKGPED